MFLAEVKGNVVATHKDSYTKGLKLLIVEPLKVLYKKQNEDRLEPVGSAIVAVDRIGAGIGELVLVTQGSSARLAEGMKDCPIDAIIIGLVDKATIRDHELKR